MRLRKSAKTIMLPNLDLVTGKKRKNDAKLRYHQSGRSASQRISAQASSSVIESKKYKQVNIKVEIHERKRTSLS